jgi:26S proteasome regulatory subunit N12
VQHKWSLVDGYIVFKGADAAAVAADKAVPSLELINNALLYAKELERIV